MFNSQKRLSAKKAALLAGMGISLLLTGCGNLVPSRTHMETMETTLGTVPEVMEEEVAAPEAPGTKEMTEVLENRRRFFMFGVGGIAEYTVADYCDSFLQNESLSVPQYGWVDLNSDQEPELVLQLERGGDSGFAVLVLNREEEGIWGYPFFPRQMREIKADGTFSWSGGAAYHGAATISLHQGNPAFHHTIWVEEVENKLFYYQEGTEISEEAFWNLMAEQDQKESISWTAYDGWVPKPTEAAVETEPVPEPSHSAAPPIVVSDYAPFYRGFTPVKFTDRERMERFSSFGTRIIADDETWHEVMDEYCPGIPYFVPAEFNNHFLLVSIRMGARPSYLSSGILKSVSIQDGYFLLDYEEDEDDGVYALSGEEITHFYVEILQISKDYLSEELVRNHSIP